MAFLKSARITPRCLPGHYRSPSKRPGPTSTATASPTPGDEGYDADGDSKSTSTSPRNGRKPQAQGHLRRDGLHGE